MAAAGPGAKALFQGDAITLCGFWRTLSDGAKRKLRHQVTFKEDGSARFEAAESICKFEIDGSHY